MAGPIGHPKKQKKARLVLLKKRRTSNSTFLKHHGPPEEPHAHGGSGPLDLPRALGGVAPRCTGLLGIWGIQRIVTLVPGPGVPGSQGPRVPGSQGSRVRGSEGPRVPGSQGPRVKGSKGQRAKGSKGQRVRNRADSQGPSEPRALAPPSGSASVAPRCAGPHGPVGIQRNRVARLPNPKEGRCAGA